MHYRLELCLCFADLSLLRVRSPPWISNRAEIWTNACMFCWLCSAGCVLPALPGTRQDLQRHLQRPNSTNIVSLQLLISYSLCLQDTITSSSKKLQAMAKSPNPGASSKLHQPAVVLAGRSDTWQGSPLIPGQEPTTSSHVLKPTSP